MQKLAEALQEVTVAPVAQGAIVVATVALPLPEQLPIEVVVPTAMGHHITETTMEVAPPSSSLAVPHTTTTQLTE